MHNISHMKHFSKNSSLGNNQRMNYKADFDKFACI